MREKTKLMENSTSLTSEFIGNFVKEEANKRVWDIFEEFVEWLDKTFGDVPVSKISVRHQKTAISEATLQDSVNFWVGHNAIEPVLKFHIEVVIENDARLYYWIRWTDGMEAQIDEWEYLHPIEMQMKRIEQAISTL